MIDSKSTNGVIYVNIRGLSPGGEKTTQLGHLAEEAGAFLIVITESWLCPEIQNAEVRIDGFYLLRTDRSSRGRGGTCIYVKQGLSAVASLSYSNDSVEALVLKIKELKTIVFSIYRPPGSNEEDFSEVLCMIEEEIMLAQAHNARYPKILGLGDFNFPLLDWTRPTRLPDRSEDGNGGQPTS